MFTNNYFFHRGDKVPGSDNKLSENSVSKESLRCTDHLTKASIDLCFKQRLHKTFLLTLLSSSVRQIQTFSFFTIICKSCQIYELYSNCVYYLIPDDY